MYLTSFLRPFIIVQIVLSGSLAFGADAPEPKTVVEISQPQAPAQFVGTVVSAGSEQERPFQKKITERPIDLWAGNAMPPPVGANEDPQKAAEQKKLQDEELAKAKAYSLAKQAGEYVGWFAIVRDSTWNEGAQRMELLLQHCYSDGLSNPDIQVVSINGAGDFRAMVREKAGNIPLLSLVHVYGKVSAGKDGVPEVAADYVRVWDWGLFTFMDYGIDKTNAKWRALRHIDSHEIYDPHPSSQFYEQVLGKRESADKPSDKGGPADGK
jgi:hypothetical protein